MLPKPRKRRVEFLVSFELPYEATVCEAREYVLDAVMFYLSATRLPNFDCETVKVVQRQQKKRRVV